MADHSLGMGEAAGSNPAESIMKQCSCCGDKPTIISVPESDWYFCSIQCMTQHTYSREDSVREAERMLGYDEENQQEGL